MDDCGDKYISHAKNLQGQGTSKNNKPSSLFCKEMVYRIRSSGLRIKPSGLFCKEMVYHIRSSGLRIKPAGLFCKEMVYRIR